VGQSGGRKEGKFQKGNERDLDKEEKKSPPTLALNKQKPERTWLVPDWGGVANKWGKGRAQKKKRALARHPLKSSRSGKRVSGAIEVKKKRKPRRKNS